MIKAVFFDLYYTVVTYDPPREETEAQTLQEFGIEVKPEVFSRPMAVADDYIYQEMSRSPISKRSREEQLALFVEYQRILLREAGVAADEKLLLSLVGKMQQADRKLVLYDDVLPALTELKDKGLTLGLISNIDRDITPLLAELGLPALLQVVVTSQDAGFTKPHPEIFREALRRADVQPAEAVFVGDQYQIDVVGAERAGMRGILLDRGGYSEENTASPRIRSLTEIADHL
jgi:putative hydrolase of the HAD superfamily